MACHHPPDKAGKFTGDSGSGDVVWTGESDSFEFAFKALIGFVSIGNDSWLVSLLPGFYSLGFSSYLASAEALGRFGEQSSQVRIAFFGDAHSVDICAAGMLTGNKAKVCGKMVSGRETVEITDFHDGR